VRTTALTLLALAALTGCGGDSTAPPDDGGSQEGPVGHIVFTDRAATGYHALILYDVKTKARSTVFSEVGFNERYPALSPDGSRIAFSSDRNLNHDGNTEIYIINTDGTGLKRITSNTFGDVAPSWSPDGKKLVFLQQTDGAGGLGERFAIANADGTGEHVITGLSGGNPAWSPDGKQIAFTGDQVLAIADTNGGNLHSYDMQMTVGEPAWSPDGSQIAMDCVMGNSQEICLIKPDGSGITNLTSTPAPGGEIQPSWSPDGKYVAYTAFRNDNDDVAFRKTDGTGEVDVTSPSPAEQMDPSWGP
jgi:Tol biopolymer transport system component